MKHYLKTKSIGLINEDKLIKNEEVINLINERDEINVGTQVVAKMDNSKVLIEVIEIEGENTWWQIKQIRGMSNGRKENC